MRVGSTRALALAAVLVAGTVSPAGVMAASGGASGTSVTSGAPALRTMGPAGFSVACTATAFGAPLKLAGVLGGTGKGACVMTGDFGAPWVLEVTVRLQSRQSGAWRTRAIATAQLVGTANRKRIPWLRAGVPCTGASARPWRIQVVAAALANEKVVSVLDKDIATSATATIAC